MKLTRQLTGRSTEVASAAPMPITLSGLGRIDTAGALLLLELSGQSADNLAHLARDAGRPELAELVALVTPRGIAEHAPADVLWCWNIGSGLEVVGRRVMAGLSDVFENLAFYGELMAATGRLMRRPLHLRWIPTLSQIDRCGVDALPIIATANLFVGATIGFLGASLLAQFGASVFAVELVGVSVLREFAVLISAIILSGRSASSFAAEIGAMKMNQELDAMRVMGVDPFDSLVLPRFIGLLAVMPFLVLIAMIAGLAGGMLVLWPTLDLSPQFFLTRIVDNVGIKHFWLGLVKAPVMAVVVATIGCRHGFAAGDDVNQLGRHVTSAVVQALFAILTLDAVFALIFMELGL